MSADEPTILPREATEATQSITSSDLSAVTAQEGPYPYDATWELPPLPPPPPPAPRHYKKRIVTLLLLTCLVIISASAGALAATLYWRSLPGALMPLSSRSALGLTPTSDLGYTANDILGDFIAAGAHPFYIQRNVTISQWSDGVFSVSVPATSSVTFADASDCSGPCDPHMMGLWVYKDNATATQAYNEVNEENSQASIYPPQVLAPVPTTIFIQARCLLLGADLHSIYVQVVKQFCR
ncbi:hypothetical protein [Thermogemmatispora sp.]|uniref:hypothetical protein n=1 Tax=Thermogemmatispora sp. TaxID=1968838 RepID=UPI002ACC0A3A|nr:hypothetical protein [Thermogemmatispora sp.]